MDSKSEKNSQEEIPPSLFLETSGFRTLDPSVRPLVTEIPPNLAIIKALENHTNILEWLVPEIIAMANIYEKVESKRPTELSVITGALTVNDSQGRELKLGAFRMTVTDLLPQYMQGAIDPYLYSFYFTPLNPLTSMMFRLYERILDKLQNRNSRTSNPYFTLHHYAAPHLHHGAYDKEVDEWRHGACLGNAQAPLYRSLQAKRFCDAFNVGLVYLSTGNPGYVDILAYNIFDVKCHVCDRPITDVEKATVCLCCRGAVCENCQEYKCDCGAAISKDCMRNLKQIGRNNIGCSICEKIIQLANPVATPIQEQPIQETRGPTGWLVATEVPAPPILKPEEPHLVATKKKKRATTARRRGKKKQRGKKAWKLVGVPAPQQPAIPQNNRVEEAEVTGWAGDRGWDN